MIVEIITKKNKRYNKKDGKTISIKWSNWYGCFLINNYIRIYMDDIKSLTCDENI